MSVTLDMIDEAFAGLRRSQQPWELTFQEMPGPLALEKLHELIESGARLSQVRALLIQNPFPDAAIAVVSDHAIASTPIPDDVKHDERDERTLGHIAVKYSPEAARFVSYGKDVDPRVRAIGEEEDSRTNGLSPSLLRVANATLNRAHMPLPSETHPEKVDRTSRMRLRH